MATLLDQMMQPEAPEAPGRRTLLDLMLRPESDEDRLPGLLHPYQFMGIYAPAEVREDYQRTRIAERKRALPPEQWAERGRIGLWENWARKADREYLEMVPFLGGVPSAQYFQDVGAAMDKLDAHRQGKIELGPEDRHYYEELVKSLVEVEAERQARGYTVPAKVSNVVASMVGWVGEFLASGASAKAAGAAVKLKTAKLLEQYGKTTLKRRAIKGAGALAGWTARGVARTPYMPGRIARQYARKRLPQGQFNEAGEFVVTKDSAPATRAFLSAYGNVLVEAMSEEAGETIGAVAKGAGGVAGAIARRIPGARRLKGRLGRLLLRLSGKKAPKFQALMKKAGYHGILEEMGEERLAGVMHAVFRTEDFGLVGDEDTLGKRLIASVPGGEDLLVEALAFSVPGAVQRVGMAVERRAAKLAKAKTASRTDVAKALGVPASRLPAELKTQAQREAAVKEAKEAPAEKAPVEVLPPEIEEKRVNLLDRINRAEAAIHEAGRSNAQQDIVFAHARSILADAQKAEAILTGKATFGARLSTDLGLMFDLAKQVRKGAPPEAPAPEVAAPVERPPVPEVAAEAPVEAAPVEADEVPPPTGTWLLESHAVPREGGYTEMRIAGERDPRRMTTKQRTTARRRLEALATTRLKADEAARVGRDLQRLERAAGQRKGRGLVPPSAPPAKPSVRRAAIYGPESQAPKFWTSEIKLLRLKYENQIKGAEVGAREESRRLEALKVDLVKEVENRLAPAIRGRMLKQVARVKTTAEYERALKVADRLLFRHMTRQAQRSLRETIKKLNVNKMAPPFRGLAEDILSGLDPHAPTEATLARLKGTAEYLKASPEHEVPSHVLEELERLSQKAVTDLTIEEAGALEQTFKSLTAQSRLKQRLKKGAWQRELDTQLDAMVEAMGGTRRPTQPTPAGPRAVPEGRKIRGLPAKAVGFVKGALARLGKCDVGLTRTPRILTSLDGGVPGPNYRNVHERVDKGQIQRNEAITDEHAKFEAAMKEAGLSLEHAYTGQEEIAGIPDITPTTKIEIWLASHDAGKLLHLVGENGFTAEQAQEIAESLSPQELAVGRYMLEHYAKEWAPIAAVHEDITGEVLDDIDGYSPITLDRETGRPLNEELADEMLGRAFMRVRHQVERRFTKHRRGGKQPLRLDAIANFTQNIARFEHFKALAPVVRDINAMFADEAWREAVLAQAKGRAKLQTLQRWLEDGTKTGIPQRLTDVGNILSWFRRNATVSMIGINILSGGRAAISGLHSIGFDGDPANLWYHLDAVMKTPREWMRSWKDARRILPELKERFTRGIQREFREMGEKARYAGYRRGKWGKVTRGKAGLDSGVLFHYRAIDGTTCTASTVAHYNKMIDRDASPEEAQAYARRAIESTQPMGGEIHLPAWFRGSDFSKMFATFQNMASQEYNILFHDIPSYWRQKGRWRGGVATAAGRSIWTLFWAKLLPMFFLSVLSRGRMPKREEWLKDAAIYGVVPLWPLGLVIAGAIRGYGALSAPPLAWADDVARAVKARTTSAIAHALLAACCRVTGIVWNQPVRTITGAVDLAKGETGDVRRLVVSEWALKPQFLSVQAYRLGKRHGVTDEEMYRLVAKRRADRLAAKTLGNKIPSKTIGVGDMKEYLKRGR